MQKSKHHRNEPLRFRREQSTIPVVDPKKQELLDKMIQIQLKKKQQAT